MADKSRKSYFEIDADRYNPRKWTPDEVVLMAEFLEFGFLSDAAVLARLGIKLLTSEQLEPKGGDIEFLGYSAPKQLVADPHELYDLRYEVEDDITELVPVYRGKTVYAVRLYEGDDDGGSEPVLEVKPSLDEAEALLRAYASP